MIDTQEPALEAPSMMRTLTRATALLIVFLLLTGVVYPLVVTGLAQALFPTKASGSIVEFDGAAIGSSLIGQEFFGQPGYLWGRPSAAGDGYDASQSSGSNLGPTNAALIDDITERLALIQAAHPERAGQRVPVDLVTASASGLDPHISPAAAEYQTPRIAHERGIPEAVVRDAIARHTSGRTLGILGEARVNVLLVNLDLDALGSAQGR